MYGCMIVHVYSGNLNFMFKSCVLLKKFEIFSFLDGSLYVITPVDPLFLILPYLTKFSQKVHKPSFDCAFVRVLLVLLTVH